MGIVITAYAASIESGERMRSVINNGGRLDYVITYSCSVIPYLPPRDKTRNRNAADLFQNGIRSIFRMVAWIFFNEIHLFLSRAWESDQPTDQRPICRVAQDFINNQLEKSTYSFTNNSDLRRLWSIFLAFNSLGFLMTTKSIFSRFFDVLIMTMDVFDQEQR